MDDRTLKAVAAKISKPRLSPYLEDCQGDLRSALELYAWNNEVSNGFYGLVRHLEVALRNTIHDRLTSHFGRPDWWEAHCVQLSRWGTSSLEAAKDKLRKAGKAGTPDQLVAELSFSFWVALLGRAKGADYHAQFWAGKLAKDFPREARHRIRRHDELDQLRLFRNRIAHHEPIHQRHLEQDRRTILRNLGYLSPEVREWVDAHDRLPRVLRAAPSRKP